MRTILCLAILMGAAAAARAQQVQLLEADVKDSGSAKDSSEDGMVQVIAPSEDKPAEAAKPAAAAPAAPVAAAPEVKVSTAAAKPVARVNKKKKAASAAQVKASTAAVAAAQPAAPAAAPAAPVAAAPAKAAPAPGKTAAVPAKAQPPAPAPAAEKKLSPIGAALKPAPETAAPVKPAAPARPAQHKPAPPAPTPAPEAGAGFSVGKHHVVSGGDTLWGISGKYYSDPHKWGKIYNANLKTVSNPDRIYPKDELVIPDISEEVRPVAAAKPAAPAAPAAVPAPAPVPAPQPEAAPLPAAKPADPELVQGFSPSDLSEEMPVDQKEWGNNVLVVKDSWREDGQVTGKEKASRDEDEEGLTLTGGIIGITMSAQAKVKIGDYLAVYMKGGDAYDKGGKRMGREIQAVGMAEVISADGTAVKARVLDAVTPVVKGYVVKKR